uniref:Ig-like domain-containing protein n=1 Tax=Oryctolagus cuniculus TaxID=9986 RepID=G1U6P5_RABIT
EQALLGIGALVARRAASATTPSLFPLSLPCPVSGETVVVGCLIRGFFPPGPLSVSWNVSGEIVNFPPAPPGISTSYTACSELILPFTQCQDQKSAACDVVYNSTKRSLPVGLLGSTPGTADQGSRNLISGCQPSLSLQRPDLGDLLLGRDASLTCTLSGLKNPEGAAFSWEPTNGNEAVQQSPQRDLSGCYSVSSVLPSSAETWKAKTEFTCKVAHDEIDSGSLTATISRGIVTPPQVHLLPPPSEELALNEQVTLTCLVQGFSPEDVLVSWRHQGQEVPEDSFLVWKSLPKQGQDPATYAVTSLLRVSAEDWNQGDSYSCVVGHEGLAEHFTQKTIDRLAGKPTHVNVSVVVADVEAVCY